MKRSNFKFFVVVTLLCGGVAGCMSVFGGEPLGGLTLIESAEAEDMAGKFWTLVAPVLAVIGAARIVLKPIFTWLAGGMEKVITKAEQTEDARDDAALDKLFSSKVYFWFAWLADLLFSAKLPIRKPK